MHLNKYIFRSQKLQKYLTYEAHFFFSEQRKFNLDSKNGKKIRQKIHGFLDNLIDSFTCSLPKGFQKEAPLCI